MNKPIEVREFDSIICNKDYADDNNFTCISKKDFDDLATFIHDFTGNEEIIDALDVMRIEYKRGIGDVISFKNYVGLIQMKTGFQIQVLPKIDYDLEKDSGNKETKTLFLRMLRSMKDFPCKVFNDASLNADRMNLYEIFINMYIQETRQLVKHGIKSAYIGLEDNLNYFKGKLLINRHLRTNLAHKERFYVAYDEFHQNRPENKLVKATLEKLQKITNSAENSKEIKQLLLPFEMVEASVNYEKDFSRVVINRDTKDYENLIKWSKVFLLNESFTTFSGSTTSRALLFPMESVYESYVAQEMKRFFSPNGWEVTSQDKGRYLFEEPRHQFALRPDIVLRKDDRTIVMDTKWKRLIPNERLNYGISQSDMYQMYAYSKKYRDDNSDHYPEVWLLYPYNHDMADYRDIRFDSGDGTKIRVWFIDLRKSIEEELKLMKCEIDNQE